MFAVSEELGSGVDLRLQFVYFPLSRCCLSCLSCLAACDHTLRHTHTHTHTHTHSGDNIHSQKEK